WTKDHPISNVIGDPSHSVSTRKQLKTDVMWCYFDAFLTFVEPKNFKQAMTEPSWIGAMHKEIHEFERLQVPSAKRVKFSSTNIRLETVVLKKEETCQVIINVIKNTTCFKAFTISADVPKIFMQQFWYTIKKVQDTDSYKFYLAKKKYTVNAEVFRIIFNICPRVEGLDFTYVPANDTALTFLINLSYKGLLNRHNMFVDLIIISDVYQIFKNQIPPKKKQRQSKRRVKKKVTLSADDNIISDDPDAALELAKSISQTKAEEAEAARKVHATHSRSVIESIFKSTKKKSGGRSLMSVVNQDTPSTPNLKPATSKTKLKCSPSLTPQEQKASNIMQALKESKKTSKRQLDGNADDEGDDHVSDTQDVDNEDDETESDEDEIYKYKIRVCNDEDVEIKDAEVEEFDKGEEKVTDAAKEEAEKL
nr:putative ribonuclease H-like domain-containing protein [Tanacetum cinerariifolium]